MLKEDDAAAHTLEIVGDGVSAGRAKRRVRRMSE